MCRNSNIITGKESKRKGKNYKNGGIVWILAKSRRIVSDRVDISVFYISELLELWTTSTKIKRIGLWSHVRDKLCSSSVLLEISYFEAPKKRKETKKKMTAH